MDRKYLSSNIQTFFKILINLPRKELQLKGNWPFNNYKISNKHLKVQFLKTRDAMDLIKTMSKKKLKQKNAFDKTITTYYCQNIL